MVYWELQDPELLLLTWLHFTEPELTYQNLRRHFQKRKPGQLSDHSWLIELQGRMALLGVSTSPVGQSSKLISWLRLSLYSKVIQGCWGC